ncbi:MAG: type I-C CRISPR-associated protein Cas8c/Csd1, partial [Oscillospiraceae bacterium]|nr:type I-C CRISPR-associated protein Cas8c/Csd1 [Oscillospiraceae bacterium]
MILSWTQELYKVYEQQCGIEHNDGNVLLPVSHSTANAQIEVTLKQDGSFVSAKALTKDDGKNTIIPVTEDSGARANGVFPMPFADKLLYIAGDYPQYATGKRADNRLFYQAYLEQLGRW